MDCYDLNILNYDLSSLKNFFKLDDDYVEDDVLKMETVLKNSIRDYKADDEFKQQFFSFLDNTKKELITALHSNNSLLSSEVNYKEPINSFNTSIARGVLNKLRKRTTVVSMAFNTLFRNPNSISTSNCNFIIPYPLKNVVSMQLKSFELPNCIDMFNEANKTNCFYIKEYITNNTGLIKVPEGHYDASALATAIQTAINTTIGGTNFTVTIDQHSCKTTITNSAHRFDIFFMNKDTNPIFSKNIGWLLGFRKPIFMNTPSCVSEGLFDDCLPYVYFVLNDYSISSSSKLIASFSDSFIDKNILAKIQPLGDCREEGTFIKREYFGPVDISKFDLRLLDKYGELVYLNMMDYSFTIELELVYDI